MAWFAEMFAAVRWTDFARDFGIPGLLFVMWWSEWRLRARLEWSTDTLRAAAKQHAEQTQAVAAAAAEIAALRRGLGELEDLVRNEGGRP